MTKISGMLIMQWSENALNYVCGNLHHYIQIWRIKDNFVAMCVAIVRNVLEQLSFCMVVFGHVFPGKIHV